MSPSRRTRSEMSTRRAPQSHAHADLLPAPVNSDFFKAPAQLPQNEVHRVGHGSLLLRIHPGPAPDRDEPVRLQQRERPEQDAMDDAEDRRIGADAESERGDREQREPGRTQGRSRRSIG